MSFGHTSVAGSESAVARQAPSVEWIRDFIGRWLNAWNSRQADQVEVDGVDFQEYRDGRIAKLRVVFDLMTVSRQLGVMPASGSRGERAMAAAQRGVIRVQSEYRRLRKDG
jgi:hypothetical protein